MSFTLRTAHPQSGVLLPLSPTEQQELNDHLQTGHLRKTNLCRGCLEKAEGPRKIHKSIRDIDKATQTLHIDIAGPLVTSDDGYVYFLVGALRMPGFPLAERSVGLIKSLAARCLCTSGRGPRQSQNHSPLTHIRLRPSIQWNCREISWIDQIAGS